MTLPTTPLPRLIGLNGRARSGKDTAAAYLVRVYGYERVGWADALRACAQAVNPIIGFDRMGPVRWAQLHNEYGYEGAKDHSKYGEEFRRILLTLGTEAGRKILGENVWVNALLDKLEPGKRYVFADTRFPNEAEAVTERNGAVIRIHRPGLAKVAHESETALDHWEFDAEILNNGTLTEFYRLIDHVVGDFMARPGRWASTR